MIQHQGRNRRPMDVADNQSYTRIVNKNNNHNKSGLNVSARQEHQQQQQQHQCQQLQNTIFVKTFIIGRWNLLQRQPARFYFLTILVIVAISILSHKMLLTNLEQSFITDRYLDDSIYKLPLRTVESQLESLSSSMRETMTPLSSYLPESTAKLIINTYDKTKIRRWGCRRYETPLIFVHVGKAGGGMIRARFAASAINYNRQQDDWDNPKLDQHYYPVKDDKNNMTIRQGKFCNSINHNFINPPPNISLTKPPKRTYEPTIYCNATTPLGMALACPQPSERLCMGCDDLTSQNCDTVYMGHNYLGSELHWLPPQYLSNWWNQSWTIRHAALPKSINSNIQRSWSLLIPSNNSTREDSSKYWCEKEQTERPSKHRISNKLYLNCSFPLAAKADSQYHKIWETIALHHSLSTENNDIISSTTTNHVNNNIILPQKNYAPIYASLPLHRVTVLRDPWTWLMSKFFWHKLYKTYTCDDLSTIDKTIKRFLLAYIVPVCGTDCIIRYNNNMMTLEEIQAQAESNLRHSFSVVGLLNETDKIYDMVTTRIGYVDMTLNPHILGDEHSTGKGEEQLRCKSIFTNFEFQQKVRELVPTIKIMEEIYHVAVEVNQFQQQELQQCVKV